MRARGLGFVAMLALSCTRKKEAEGLPPAPLPAPPASASAPSATPLPREVSLGLPRGCKAEGGARAHRLAGKEPLFFSADGAENELVVADRATSTASVVRLADGTTKPLAYFPEGKVPLFAQAGGVWLSALSWPLSGADTRVLLGRDDRGEVVATGEAVDVADLRCTGDRCALLASRVLRTSGAGASVFFGGPRETPWRRVDVDPERASRMAPFSIARLDDRGADVALSDGEAVAFARVEGDKAVFGPTLEAKHGALDALVLETPVALAHGAPVKGDCGVPRSLLAVTTPAGTRAVPIDAAVSSMVSRRVGEHGLVAWVAPASCGEAARRVVYALVLTPKGEVQGAPMAIADANGVALSASGDRVTFHLLRRDLLVTVTARCSFLGPRVLEGASMQNIKGRLVPNSRGFAFVEPEGQGLSVFVSPKLLGLSLLDDVVEVSAQPDDRGRLSATSLRLVSRPRTRLLGKVDARGMLAVDRTLATRDVRLVGAAKAGSHVLAALDGETATVLSVVDPREVPLASLLERYGIDRSVPDAVVRAASTAKLVRDPTRRDLRGLPTITVDAPSSRDLDDALSVYPAEPDGSLRLLVSIADVDALVTEGSPLDDDARRRATSVYLAGLVVNMLPPALSEDGLSLLPGMDRPALTAELRIDPEGRVTSTDVWKTMIRSTARLDYEGVTRFFDEGDASAIPAEVQDTLRWLRTAAARIDQQRRARGGVTLAQEEATIHVDDDTREPVSMEARKSTSAHLFIERLMVATNEAVAAWLLARGLPGVFRVHPPPTRERVEKLEVFAKNLGFMGGFGGELTPFSVAAFSSQVSGLAAAPAMETMIGRTLGHASYTDRVALHFGLGAERYLHFTSPIRRYADLAVHRVIKRFLAGERGPSGSLEALAAHIDAKSRLAARAEAEWARMMAARLFQSRIGEVLTGTVVAVRPFGVVVQLTGTGASGTIAFDDLPGGRASVDQANEVVAFGGERLTIGMSAEVRVVAARPEEGRIDLALADGPARPARRDEPRKPSRRDEPARPRQDEPAKPSRREDPAQAAKAGATAAPSKRGGSSRPRRRR